MESKNLVQFKKTAQAFHIAYCMANYGMQLTATEVGGMEGIDLDGKFQVGPADPERKPISEISTKQALSGMQKNGPFSQGIAHGLIVFIYGLWDETFRSKIANELGCETNQVMCNVMGDIRHVRNMIVHNNSFADHRIKKLTVLKWPAVKGPFAAKDAEMQDIQLAINTMQITVGESSEDK